MCLNRAEAESTKKRKRTNRKGSLLLEALLVIIILSVSLTLIIQSFVSSLRGSVLSSDYSKAAILADNKMFDLMSRRSLDGACDEEDRFAVPFDKFKYGVEVNNLSTDGVQKGLYEVLLDISWVSGQNTKKVSLATYVFSFPDGEE